MFTSYSSVNLCSRECKYVEWVAHGVRCYLDFEVLPNKITSVARERSVDYEFCV